MRVARRPNGKADDLLDPPKAALKQHARLDGGVLEGQLLLFGSYLSAGATTVTLRRGGFSTRLSGGRTGSSTTEAKEPTWCFRFSVKGLHT